jgi:LacI family transcriptional regulator
MNRQKITIKDVAKHAGVGVGTVSRVLNRSAGVSPKVKELVEKSIAALGYQPDTLARSLRTKRTNTIAFFVNDISNVAFSTIAKGIHEELEKHGYSLLLYNTGDTRVEEKILESYKIRKVDGMIISLQTERNSHFVEQILESGIPFILLDREFPGTNANAVLSDYYNGIREAVEYLISLGHRKIGYIGSGREIRPARDSLRGYLDAMKLNQLAVDEDWIKQGDFSAGFGAAASGELLDRKVTAIVACSYQLLIGTMETVRERGIRIPGELSVIGFEDSDFARLLNPAITVVKRPLLQIGRQMAHLLLQEINEKERSEQPVKLVVPTELIKRESCAPPGGAN